MNPQGIRIMEKETRRKLLALLFQTPDKDELIHTVEEIPEHPQGIKAEWEYVLKKLNDTTLFDGYMSIKNLKKIRSVAERISDVLRTVKRIKIDERPEQAGDLKKKLNKRLKIEKTYAEMVEECLTGNKKSIENMVSRTKVVKNTDKGMIQNLLSKVQTDFFSGKWFTGGKRHLLAFEGDIYENILHMVECFSQQKGTTKFHMPADPEKIKGFRYNKIKRICLDGTPKDVENFMNDVYRSHRLIEESRKWVVNLDRELRSAELFDWKDNITESNVDKASENIQELNRIIRKSVGLGVSMPDLDASEVVRLHAARQAECLEMKKTIIAMPCKEALPAGTVDLKDKALILTKMIFNQSYYGTSDEKINLAFSIETDEICAYTEALSEIYKNYVLLHGTPKALRAFAKTKIFIYGKISGRNMPEKILETPLPAAIVPSGIRMVGSGRKMG